MLRIVPILLAMTSSGLCQQLVTVSCRDASTITVEMQVDKLKSKHGYETSNTANTYSETVYKGVPIYGMDAVGADFFYRENVGRNVVRGITVRYGQNKVLHVPEKLCRNVVDVRVYKDSTGWHSSLEAFYDRFSGAVVITLGVGDGGGAADVIWVCETNGHVSQFGLREGDLL